MAEAADIAQVRINTGTINEDPYNDDYVSALIDVLGVDAASASIWRGLAAQYSKMVDVTEAGASHKFSDLFKNATAMATRFETVVTVAETISTAPRVNSIVRE